MPNVNLNFPLRIWLFYVLEISSVAVNRFTDQFDGSSPDLGNISISLTLSNSMNHTPFFSAINNTILHIHTRHLSLVVTRVSMLFFAKRIRIRKILMKITKFSRFCSQNYKTIVTYLVFIRQIALVTKYVPKT